MSSSVHPSRVCRLTLVEVPFGFSFHGGNTWEPGSSFFAVEAVGQGPVIIPVAESDLEGLTGSECGACSMWALLGLRVPEQTPESQVYVCH